MNPSRPGIDQSPPEPAPVKGRALLANPNLWCSFGVTLSSVMGMAIISPSFPGMMAEFGVSSQAVVMVITAYTLPGALLAPIFGMLADRVGRKEVLIPSLIFFSLCGGACAWAPSLKVLILLRLLQGVPAGAIASVNWTILSENFGPGQRTQALGYNAGVLSMGSLTFPLLGGLLAGRHWSDPFLVQFVVLGLALVAWRGLQVQRSARNSESLGSYCRNCLRIVSRPAVLALLGSRILTFGLRYGFFIAFLPFIMSERFQTRPWLIGVVLSSAALATMITSSLGGRLGERFRPEPIILASYLAMAASLASIALVGNPWAMLIPALLWGLGNGLNLPQTINLLSLQSSNAHRAAVMSLNGMSVRLGQTIGPTVSGLLTMVLGGLNLVFLAGGVLALVLGSWIVYVLAAHRQPVGTVPTSRNGEEA